MSGNLSVEIWKKLPSKIQRTFLLVNRDEESVT